MIDFSQLLHGSRLGRPAIIAHRGAGHRPASRISKRLRHSKPIVPENSLEAFERAIGCGADAVEFDLRRTADGVIVVHHNVRLKGTGISIRRRSFSRLQNLALRRGVAIATLEETLKLCAGRIALDIELKEAGYEPEIVALVKRYYDLNNVVFSSFIDDAIAALKKSAPKAWVGLLLGLRPPASIMNKSLREGATANRLNACRADFVAPHWRLLKLPFFSNQHGGGRPIIAWTVNRPAVAGRLIDAGCAGIITNFPEKILPLVHRARG